MTSFEYAEFIVKSGSFSTRLVIVYHPPYSREHSHTDRAFLAEFTTYLESIILSVEPLLIIGDFNLHVDDTDDAVSAAFLVTLASMNLVQHVTGPTHKRNHTFDLVITRQSDKVLLRQPKVGFLVSDHAPIFCSLNSTKPRFRYKSYTYRKYKVVDVVALKEDLSVSTLCNDDFAHLDDLVNCYNFTSSSLIDRYAPLNKRSVLNRPRVPWIDSDIKAAIRERRKAERKWRANKLPADFATCKMKKELRQKIKLMNSARSRYYSDFIRVNSSDQRKLFRAGKSLLSEPRTLSLPDGTDTVALANNIGKFFVKKVKDIRSKLDTSTSSSSIADATISRRVDVSLTEFSTLLISVDDVRSKSKVK